MPELAQQQIEQILSRLDSSSTDILDLKEALLDRRKKSVTHAVIGGVSALAALVVAVVAVLNAFEASIERVTDLKEENRIQQLRLMFSEEREKQRPVDNRQDDDIQALRFDVDRHQEWLRRLDSPKAP